MRRRLKSLLVLSLCGCLAALAQPARAQDEAPVDTATGLPPQTRVTVAQAGDALLYLPVYIAMQEGFFSARGLDVTLLSTGSDKNTFAALAGGQAQFGISDPTVTAIESARGNNAVVIAAVVNGVPLWGVAKPAVPVIASEDQLKPYTVGTYPAPSSAFTLQEEMFLGGGQIPNIKQAPYGSLLTMLGAGQIDIALEQEPDVSLAVANGDHVVYSMARRMPQLLFAAIEVLSGTAQKKPAEVQRFVSALFDAEKFIHADPYKTVEDAEAHFPTLDRTIVQNATVRLIAENLLPASPVMSEESWANAAQMRVKTGELPSVDAVKGTLNNSFAERAEQYP